jgi:XTP/dITP diphosphohydrolase
MSMKLHLATGNAHKVAEFAEIFSAAGLAIEVVSAAAAGGMPEVDESAATFSGNARLKAEALRAKLGPQAWVLADDSGLCVDALDGQPGVWSARFAGVGAGDGANLRKLLGLLENMPEGQRGAAFRCALVLLGPEVEQVFEGECRGRMIESARGGGGFGYDPAFAPDGYEQTFAELPSETKHRLSHRGRAAEQLVAWLAQR